MDKEDKPSKIHDPTLGNCEDSKENANKSLSGDKLSPKDFYEDRLFSTVEDSLDLSNVNLEMEKLKDKNENEVDPMLDNVKNDSALVKVLVKEVIEDKKKSSCCGE